jgi:hypothetical protein
MLIDANRDSQFPYDSSGLDGREHSVTTHARLDKASA